MTELDDVQIEPAATPRPSSGRTEFMTNFLQSFSNFIELLCWEWTSSDTRGVRLHDAYLCLDHLWRNSKACANSADGGVR